LGPDMTKQTGLSWLEREDHLPAPRAGFRLADGARVARSLELHLGPFLELREPCRSEGLSHDLPAFRKIEELPDLGTGGRVEPHGFHFGDLSRIHDEPRPFAPNHWLEIAAAFEKGPEVNLRLRERDARPG